MISSDRGPDDATKRFQDLDDALKGMVAERRETAGRRAAFLDKVAAQEAEPREPFARRDEPPAQPIRPSVRSRRIPQMRASTSPADHGKRRPPSGLQHQRPAPTTRNRSSP